MEWVSATTIEDKDAWHLIKTQYRTDTDIRAYKWCREHSSAGNFYVRPLPLQVTEWYFESEKDALLFLLRWSA